MDLNNSDNITIVNTNTNTNDFSQNKYNISQPDIVYGLTGIVNTGNTCYMNSAIQALSHLYLLTNYFFTDKENIYKILRTNARKILKDNEAFQLNSNNIIPMELKQKIQNPDYKPEMLTENEFGCIYNSTITAQFIRLVEYMWRRNCSIIPTSFRFIFSETKQKFFFGYEQHDAEEAYSCILQKMQEELAEEKNVVFKSDKKSFKEFLKFRNDIIEQIKKENDTAKKEELQRTYIDKKRSMPDEALMLEASREMKKYYGTSYSRITEIFAGFLHSSINCPDPNCKYMSNKFDPFLILSLPMPMPTAPTGPNIVQEINPLAGDHTLLYRNRMRMFENQNLHHNIITIDDCIQEYFKEEALDEKNLWSCEGCNNKVKGIKKLQLWSVPPILVIQFKRFGAERIFKDSRLVKYPLEHFDISSVVSSVQKSETKCYKYTLQCVINHTGSLHNGHYYTYCRDEDTGKWFEFNDGSVDEISSSVIVTHNAYILFYIREDMFN
ncbi:MAG: putative ubiquitin-specific protease [Satyrvirus sp.]|uniref:ubiquitinyl hydrolase 1 n=1 Tax=Satyrvirus sp. TaxID=2487771 RepID=A0A3G5AHF4_9VIRU|nr:MAG: putative ubiquitin-specific protease [Satyrvirus sp.]